MYIVVDMKLGVKRGYFTEVSTIYYYMNDIVPVISKSFDNDFVATLLNTDDFSNIAVSSEQLRDLIFYGEVCDCFIDGNITHISLFNLHVAKVLSYLSKPEVIEGYGLKPLHLSVKVSNSVVLCNNTTITVAFYMYTLLILRYGTYGVNFKVENDGSLYVSVDSSVMIYWKVSNFDSFMTELNKLSLFSLNCGNTYLFE